MARARGDVRGGQGAAAGVARTQWSHDGGGLLDVPVYGRERDASDIHPFHGGTRAVPGGTDRDSASRHSSGRRVRRRVYRSSPRAVAGARRRPSGYGYPTVTFVLSCFYFVTTCKAFVRLYALVRLLFSDVPRGGSRLRGVTIRKGHSEEVALGAGGGGVGSPAPWGADPGT